LICSQPVSGRNNLQRIVISSAEPKAE